MNIMKKHNSGFTLDQTIIVGAVIAILLTVLVSTLGTSILTRSKGSKVASLLSQLEDANIAFKTQHRVWPEEVFQRLGDTAGVPVLQDKNVMVLATGSVVTSGTTFANNIISNHKNLLTGLDLQANNVMHDFSNNGLIQQRQIDIIGGAIAIGNVTQGQRYIIRLTDIPMEIARRADQIMDGNEDFSDGLLTITNGASADLSGCWTDPLPAATQALVDICYVANKTQRGF